MASLLMREATTERLRRKFPLLDRTLDSAFEKWNGNHLLDADEWAAVVAVWTNIPTFGVCPDGKDPSLVGSLRENDYKPDAEGNPIHTLWFERPAKIAEQGGRWFVASQGQMCDWIEFLEPDYHRKMAWNYAHGHFNVVCDPKYPNPVAMVRESLAKLKGGFEFPMGVSSPARRPIAPSPKSVPMTEPIEKFAEAVRTLYREQDREEELPPIFDDEEDPFVEVAA